jgi:hypothetical protein
MCLFENILNVLVLFDMCDFLAAVFVIHRLIYCEQSFAEYSRRYLICTSNNDIRLRTTERNDIHINQKPVQ